MRLDENKAERLPFPVANVCFGAAPLGDSPNSYGYSVGEERALETVRAFFEQSPCFIDTSRNYGNGRSEQRIGKIIKEMGGLPDGCILATKLDRDFETNHLDAARARRSLEESLETLGLDRLPILHLHDPEYCSELDDLTKTGGALEELFRMKEEGLVDAVGLAMGDVDLMMQILPDWEFDALINHNRYTLLNRQANRMYDDAHARGIAIFNAAPYAGGIFAKGSANTQRVTYQDASEEQLAAVRAIEAICARYQVPAGVAALQFSMRDPRITSTIVGVSKPERVEQTLEWASHAAPDAFWQEISALPFSTKNPEADRIFKPC
ncbi:aldo/keto reductase [Hoeflea prorocentri]|uniref:Aldo/keto reductase n=1 Tax=Hoeflea prorocentri TaxID=1922333 RepID=A0A9X3UK88_9HYPH|nr:aldo/keto reductase [Hoeflea prorocentri]MCY6382194.1 aldo/keto reductase [Hoeflea prorocentri]MDA5399994.1 aldo/keto reductase [Hoeflea prorocentri]